MQYRTRRRPGLRGGWCLSATRLALLVSEPEVLLRGYCRSGAFSLGKEPRCHGGLAACFSLITSPVRRVWQPCFPLNLFLIAISQQFRKAPSVRGLAPSAGWERWLAMFPLDLHLISNLVKRYVRRDFTETNR